MFGDKNHKAFSRFCLCGHEKSGLKRFKNVFLERVERSSDGTEELLSVSAYFGIKPRSETLDEGDHLSRAESLEGYKVCQAGDLVINIMLAWNRGLGFSWQRGIVSPAYCVFYVVDGSVPKFLDYLVRSDDCIRYFKTHSAGIMDSRLRLYPESFGRLFTAIPPACEQTQIARFLDHETARIDALIEEQQRLIELLKEKRQAVISHAVTKGLDPTVPIKDSGVEWLGEVPAHWVCKSYRYAAVIYRGKFSHRPRNDPSLYDGEFAFIQTGDIARADKYIRDYKQTLNEKGVAVSQKFPAETLVMAIAANVGDTAILGFEAYAPDSVVGFKPERGIELEFLRFSLIAALQELKKTSTQSTQANLNIDRISGIQSVFPPVAEQDEITNYLNSVMDQFSLLEQQAEASIALMNERRSALISAAVTGKIDVRGWQPPASAQVPVLEVEAV
ncbi:restriction endonuclease subunit S [Pseudomonas aeruginosa]|nr:restriction endonuclease subunit S [Pseudomonas aeruginosa]